MSVTTLVEARPTCTFCDKPAVYDGRTQMGAWAYMCENHFQELGVGLGTGRGHKLIVAPFPCPHCGAMIEPEGSYGVDGITDVCPVCGEEIDLENL